jgi:hypothetical protein
VRFLAIAIGWSIPSREMHRIKTTVTVQSKRLVDIGAPDIREVKQAAAENAIEMPSWQGNILSYFHVLETTAVHDRQGAVPPRRRRRWRK